MINRVYIRRLTINDLHSFINLRLDALKESPTSFLVSYEDQKLAGFDFYKIILSKVGVEDVIFGAFVNDLLIGINGIYQASLNSKKHKSYIWGMFVHPNYRKKGIGKRLMLKTIFHAKNEMKSNSINLSVVGTNISAKKLYEHLGFKLWGTELKAVMIYGEFYNEDHMTLIF